MPSVSGKKKHPINVSSANGTNPDKKCTPILSVNTPINGIKEAIVVPKNVKTPTEKPLTFDGNNSVL